MGRPTDYTDEAAVAICTLLALGKPLTRICRENQELPDISTVYRWLIAHKSFRDMYAMSREDQADTMADEIIEISDDGSNDTYVTDDGVTMTNHDVIARSKLRVDARKWVAAKLKPRKYGDKIHQEHTGADGAPIQVITGIPQRPASGS